MEGNIEYIEHQGRITRIDASKKIVMVALEEQADCGECPAGKLCENFSPDRNVVKVPVADVSPFKTGDFVMVRGTERLHRKAIMLVTVIPTIALIVVMIGIYLLTGSQLAACLSSLGAMIFFFIALFMMRNKLAHEFVFEIHKIEKIRDK